MTLERLYKWKCNNGYNDYYLYSHDMDNALLELIKENETQDDNNFIFQLDSIHPVYIPKDWLRISYQLPDYTFYYIKS